MLCPPAMPHWQAQKSRGCSTWGFLPGLPSPRRGWGDYASSPNRSCGRPAGAFSQFSSWMSSLATALTAQSLTTQHSESPSLAGQGGCCDLIIHPYPRPSSRFPVATGPGLRISFSGEPPECWLNSFPKMPRRNFQPT